MARTAQATKCTRTVGPAGALAIGTLSFTGLVVALARDVTGTRVAGEAAATALRARAYAVCAARRAARAGGAVDQARWRDTAKRAVTVRAAAAATVGALGAAAVVVARALGAAGARVAGNVAVRTALADAGVAATPVVGIVVAAPGERSGGQGDQPGAEPACSSCHRDRPYIRARLGSRVRAKGAAPEQAPLADVTANYQAALRAPAHRARSRRERLLLHLVPIAPESRSTRRAHPRRSARAQTHRLSRFGDS